MFATAVTMGLAEWIIDDTCLVFSIIIYYEKTKQGTRWSKNDIFQVKFNNSLRKCLHVGITDNDSTF